MSDKNVFVPQARNEPILEYRPGSPERGELQKALDEAYSKIIEIPMFIGGREVRSGKQIPVFPPHRITHRIGTYYQGDAGHVKLAVEAALRNVPEVLDAAVEPDMKFFHEQTLAQVKEALGESVVAGGGGQEGVRGITVDLFVQCPPLLRHEEQ